MPASDELPRNLSPTLKLNGAPLPPGDVDALTEARVELELNMPARVTLRFLVDQVGQAGQGDDLQGNWGLDHRFKVGTALSVSVPNAASGSANVVFTGEITQLDWQLRQGAPPEVIVVAHDKAHRLGRTTKVATYQRASLAAAIRKAVSDAGLTFSNEGVAGLKAEQEYVLQQSSTLTFLNDAVDRFGGCWAIDAAGTKVTTFPWGKPRGATVALDASADLLELQVRGGSRASEVEVTDFDLATVQPLKASSLTSPLETQNAVVTATDGSTMGPLKVQTAHLAVQDQAEANALARGMHVRATAGTLVARGLTVQPSSALVPGGGVKISGGGPVDGTYFVNQVEHVYRQATGVRTRFVAGDRTPSGLADLVTPQPTANSLGRHDSLVLGVVTNNKDPEKRWRVRVKLPGLSEQDESAWAPVASVGAGKERGVAFLPEVGDVVVVGFERGDSRRPLVLGGIYTGKQNALPAKLSGQNAVLNRHLSSRLGHLIEFGDGVGPSDQYVLLQLAGGQEMLRIAKDKVVLQAPADVPITIQAGTASIAIAEEKVTVKAMEINLTGEAKVAISAPVVEVKGTAQTTVESEAVLQVKGAVATVQSEGPLTLKGMPTAIN